MPIHEADPWRLQYFAQVETTANITTEDSDAWQWYPAHRWVYDKLAVALSQGLEAGPHGTPPPRFPVFSKPITNLKGMGVGSRVLTDLEDYQRSLTPGHFWMTLLHGEHVSSDVALMRGQAAWWRHCRGAVAAGGTFDHWLIEAGRRPQLETYLGAWASRYLTDYTGMLNLESIGGRIIEAHLRVADQWPDLYEAGWLDAVVGLYARGEWRLALASGARATASPSSVRTGANTAILPRSASPRCAACHR